MSHSEDHTNCVCAYPQLKERLDRRFALRDLFEKYWRTRHADESCPRLPEIYADLLGVAIELYAFSASYQNKTANYRHGSEDDPRFFWSLAQPPNATEPGILDVYVDIISSDEFLQSPLALIDHILWGFGALFWMGNYWLGIPARSAEKKSVYSLIFAYTPKIWSHLWVNRSYIRPRSQDERDAEGYGSESVDPCYEAFGKYPEPYSRLLEWYSYLYDDYVDFLKDCTPEERALEPAHVQYDDTFMPHVGLLIWTSGNAQIIASGKELTLNRLVSSFACDESNGLANRIAHEAIVEGIGAHAFFTRFEMVMNERHTTAYNPQPAECVQAVTILSMTPALSSCLADYDLLHPIARACNFYIRTKQFWFWESTLMFFMFVTDFRAGPTPEEYKNCIGRMPALLRGGDMIDFIARGIDHLANWNPASDPLKSIAHRKHFLERYILHYTALVSETRDNPEAHTSRDRKIVQEMLARAPSQWWPSLRRLQLAKTQRGLDCQAVIQDWVLLGTALNLDMVTESMRFASRDMKQYCSLTRCEYHTIKPPTDLPLKVCKGCGEVKYCSRLCQVQHWKEEHKRRCGNRLHAS